VLTKLLEGETHKVEGSDFGVCWRCDGYTSICVLAVAVSSPQVAGHEFI
jgi:hypothetical protein